MNRSRVFVLFLVLALLALPVALGAEAQASPAAQGRPETFTVVLESGRLSASLPAGMAPGDRLQVTVWVSTPQGAGENSKVAGYHPRGDAGAWQWVETRWIGVPDLPRPTDADAAGSSPGRWLILGFLLGGQPSSLELVSNQAGNTNLCILATTRPLAPQSLSLRPDAGLSQSIGTRLPVVICIDFPDVQGGSSQTFWQEGLFGTTDTTTGTMRTYFGDQSYGRLQVEGTVYWNEAGTTWVRASHNRAWYNESYSRVNLLIDEALDAVDPYVNFSEHDGDGDGQMDGLILAYAGDCPWAWADPLWPHMGWFGPQYRDGVELSSYFLTNEYEDPYPTLPIGVYCHEYAHMIGAYDLYDYDGSSGGCGRWTLMCGPSSTQARPSLDAWHRVYLGWVEPQVVTVQERLELPEVNLSPSIVKVLLPDPYQYFLLENRTPTRFDSNLPGSGLVIWHVDEREPDNDHEWYPGHTDSGHYRVAVEQADGRWNLERNQNSGDPGDPFSPSTSFTPRTSPDSYAYNGASVGLYVLDITNPRPAVTLAIDFVPLELTLQIPNGGEQWTVGTSQIISWSSASLGGNIQLQLSRDRGAHWETLQAAAPNTGSFSWTVSGPPSSNCRVRLTSTSNPELSDSSDEDFAILPGPSLAVLSPNGGEVWLMGSLQQFTWTSSGLPGMVRLDLSRDGGTSWQMLFSSLPAGGQQAWTVTGTASSRCRVKVTSLSIPTLSDSSDSDFTLQAPPLLAITPTAFAFQATVGAGNPSPQGLSIWNAGGGTIAWTVASSAQWLTLSPTSGSSSGETDTVQLQVNAAGLLPGTYTATVTVLAPGMGNSPIFALATLSIQEEHPSLAWTPTSFSFQSTLGADDPPLQTLSVRNAGGGTMSWSVSSDVPWLTLSPTSGSSSGETDTIQLQVNAAGLLPGTYTATVTVLAPGALNSPAAVSVQFTVMPPLTFMVTLNLASGWNLVSVPVVTPSPPSEVLALLGTILLFQWDAALQTYTVPGAFSPGVAYWLKVTQAFPGFVISGQSTVTAPVALIPGWNMIGSPRLQEVPTATIRVTLGEETKSIAEAAAASWIGGSFWRWDGSTYRDLAVDPGFFTPGVGCWVKAFQFLELTFGD